MTLCALGEYLKGQLRKAKVQADVFETARLNRDLAEHMEKCAVCTGILPHPVVPLADQFFMAHVVVIGENQHEK